MFFMCWQLDLKHLEPICDSFPFSFFIQILARQQAQREEQLAQSQRHILALQVWFTDCDMYFTF